MKFTPKQAIENVCHTSQRFYNGRIYKFKDQRFPQFNGRGVKAELKSGQWEYSWVTIVDNPNNSTVPFPSHCHVSNNDYDSNCYPSFT